MCKISVITPVYNNEKYIDKLIKSLMEQSQDEVEYIIIDDGSTDSTASEIKKNLLKYPEKENCVTFISKENEGVAATRALGVKLSKGEYIIHHDSDDWADNLWLEKLYNKAKTDDSDIVFCSYYNAYEDENIFVKQEYSHDGDECARLLLKGKVGNANWDKLVRRQLFIDHNINFVQGLNMGEDFLVSLKLFHFAKKVSYINDALYYYNNSNINSITKNYTKDILLQNVEIVHLAEDFFNSESCIDSYCNELIEFKLNLKSLFVLYSKGDVKIKQLSLSIFPEINQFIFSFRSSLALRLYYFLQRYKITFLHIVIDILIFFKKCRI